MSVPVSRFTVTAMYGTVRRTETRNQAGPAMVLADRMFAEGLQEIRVTDLDGISHEREAFRLTLPVVKLLGRLER